MDRTVRERQPGRRATARRQRLRHHGLPYAQPLPQRHRTTGARLQRDRAGRRQRRTQRRSCCPHARSRAGRARGRSGLSPDRRGPPGPRTQHRFQPAAGIAPEPIPYSARDRRLCRLDSAGDRAAAVGRPPSADQRRRWRRIARTTGRGRISADYRCGHHVGQPRGDLALRCHDPARPGPDHRRAAIATHPGRRAHLADQRSGPAGADRTHRSASPGGRWWRPHLCAADRWAGCRVGNHAWRCASARRRRWRHCRPQRTLWPGTWRQPIPNSAPPAPVQSQRGTLDGLGAQARQAA